MQNQSKKINDTTHSIQNELLKTIKQLWKQYPQMTFFELLYNKCNLFLTLDTMFNIEFSNEYLLQKIATQLNKNNK